MSLMRSSRIVWAVAFALSGLAVVVIFGLGFAIVHLGRSARAAEQAERVRQVDEARRIEAEKQARIEAALDVIRTGDFIQVRTVCRQLGKTVPPDLLPRCADAHFEEASSALAAGNLVAARRAFDLSVTEGVSAKRREALESHLHAREEAAERKRAADAARAAREERERKAMAEILARQAMGQMLRDRYLDAGADIKVTVSGRQSDRIRLSWVLFNDVWAHRFQKDGIVDSLCRAGFRRIDMSDGFDWGVYWDCR